MKSCTIWGEFLLHTQTYDKPVGFSTIQILDDAFTESNNGFRAPEQKKRLEEPFLVTEALSDRPSSWAQVLCSFLRWRQPSSWIFSFHSVGLPGCNVPGGTPETAGESGKQPAVCCRLLSKVELPKPHATLDRTAGLGSAKGGVGGAGVGEGDF